MIYKKIICLCLILFIFLGVNGCSKENITVIAPSGTPAYATIFMQDYDIDVVLGSDPLVAAFGAKDYDVIIAPTNLGAKFYLSSQTYQCLATIVWGNLFLVSQSDITFDALENLDITAFGQNQTPDIILNYILNDQNIHTNISYLASASEVLSMFVLNPNGIYLVAEPQFSILEESYQLNSIDLQNAYKNITGENAYPQASVFVHKDLSQNAIDQIESDIKDSINEMYDEQNLTKVSEFMQLDNQIASQVLERSNIVYLKATQIKTDIENYLNLIMSYNSNLINEIPGEDFYR